MKEIIFEFDYKSMTIEEIESYKHFEFICDGDNKKIIAKEME